MTFEELLAVVEAGTMQDIVNSGSPQLQHLLTTACAVFEAYPHDDQMKAMACMMGMIMGTLHGEPTAAGRELGVMITHDHRIAMFKTQALVVFRESLAVRGLVPLPTEEPPKPKAKSRKKLAPVIGIVSGKRRKRVRHP